MWAGSIKLKTAKNINMVKNAAGTSKKFERNV